VTDNDKVVMKAFRVDTTIIGYTVDRTTYQRYETTNPASLVGYEGKIIEVEVTDTGEQTGGRNTQKKVKTWTIMASQQ
jgi:hypothetical protein